MYYTYECVLYKYYTIKSTRRTSLTPNIANPEQSCYIFKNGKLHPIAQALTGEQPPAMVSPNSGSAQQRPVTPSASAQRRRSSPVAAGNHSKRADGEPAKHGGGRKREHFSR